MRIKIPNTILNQFMLSYQDSKKTTHPFQFNRYLSIYISSGEEVQTCVKFRNKLFENSSFQSYGTSISGPSKYFIDRDETQEDAINTASLFNFDYHYRSISGDTGRFTVNSHRSFLDFIKKWMKDPLYIDELRYQIADEATL